MPKDEFDFDDPMELNGVALVCQEDTTDAMAECFIEEFARLGYNHKQLLALFRNPHYLGMNLVLQNRGEPYVRERIAEYFARRGQAVCWLAPEPAKAQRSVPSPHDEGVGRGSGSGDPQNEQPPAPSAATQFDTTASDPTGGAIPNLNL